MADQFLTARAYAVSDELFAISRTKTRFIVEPPGGDGLPDEATIKKVDKIVYFHDDDRIALVVPILPGSLGLEWKEGKAKLSIESALRCFAFEGETQWLALHLTLALDANGNPRFAPFDVDEWEPKNGRTLRFDQLAGATFRFPQRLGVPRFADHIGIKGFADQTGTSTELELVSEDGGVPVFTFVLKRFVAPGDQNLLPFGFGFEGRQLPPGDNQRRKMNLTVRQPRVETPSDPKAWPALHWIAELDVPGAPVIDRWNTAFVAPYVAALHTVQDGRPVSLIPELTLTSGSAPWHAKLSLLDDGKKETHTFAIRQVKSLPVADKFTIVPRTIEPQKETKASSGLRLPAFVRIGGAGAPVVLNAEIRRVDRQEQEADLARNNEGIHFALLHTGSGVTFVNEEEIVVDQRVRVGALDLLIAGTKEVKFDGLEPRDQLGEVAGGFRRTGGDGTNEKPGLPRLEMLRLILGKIGVRPGGQDDIPGEEFNESSLAFSDPEYDKAFRREPPILVDLVKATGAGKLVLDVNESSIEHNSQTIAMKLRQPVATQTPIDVVVIDPHPFFIGRVKVPKLEGELAGETNEIANWSNRAEAATWEIAGAASGFELLLPPQGVGEQMEKRAGDFIGEDGKPRPADFRFTPNARLKLRSSFFRQRFVEAPWNLRRVLGYAGQRAPGAGVEQLAFELLYGLSARVDNDDLRFAEIAARLGHLAGRQDRILPWRASDKQKDIYLSFRDTWKERYRALLSRLAIAEPYDHRQATLALTDADGVSYELRKEAHLRDPIPNRDGPSPPEFEEDGLAGGWSWGFESANILDAVLRIPTSSSGLLARPYFSALGGWGYQKAGFDRNLSSIYSDTAMGRTFSVSIERIGRISVFWNRAKHVIVYERTVQPTRQFANEQDPLIGNPVLRKVREYVEILQDERTYPEFGEAPIVRGFVRACTFPEGSRRINVNSAWGEDIGRIGWKVPLWRRGEDSLVYPRPSITLNVAGDHPGKTVPLILAEPEKLYFFTNTQAEMPPDSDLWPAVEGIDYPALPQLQPEKANFGAGKVERNNKPPEPVEPGTGGFTFAVDPSPHAVNVVQERTEDPIGAVMRNVTMVRGRLDQLLPAQSLPIVRDLLDAGIRRASAKVPANVTNLTESIKRVTDELQQAKDDFKTLVDQFGDLNNPDVLKRVKEQICAELLDRTNREADRLLDETGARRAIEELLSSMRDLQAATDRELAKVESEIDTIKEDHRKRLTELRETLTGNARIAVRSLKAAGGELPRALRRAREVLKAEAEKLNTHLDEIAKTITDEANWPDDQLAAFRKAVETHRKLLLEVLARIERAVDAAGRAASGSLPDKARTAVRALAHEVNVIADRLVALSHLAKEKLPKPKDVKDSIEHAKVAITALVKPVNDEIAALEAKLDSVIADTTIERLITEFDKAFAKAIDDAIANTQPAKEFVKDIRVLLKELLRKAEAEVQQHLDDLRKLAEKKARALCEHIVDSLVSMLNSVGPYLNDVGATLKRIFDGLEPIGDDFRNALARLQEEANRRLADLARLFDDAIRTTAERTLRLLRAFGDVPKVPGLGFDLPEIGYLFVDLRRLVDKLTPELPSVSLSPIIARANQLLDNLLNPIRIDLPSIELRERLIPFRLDQFDLSSVFPDFAGLRLDGLFSNLRLPKIANEYVRVTHGFDQQAMRGWVQIDADVPYDRPTTVFSIAGVDLKLLRARFHATSRIEAGVGQSPSQSFNGEIVGDWDLQIGGFPVVTLVETRLRFDDRGNIRFEVSPDRIKLQAVLSFISTLMEKFGYSDSGFSIRALPTGIRSTLDLPLPDIQGGSFGLANLRLGCIFELNFFDEEFDEFTIRTRFFVGSPRAPFTLTVFILGGAGWVDVQLAYVPRTKLFESRVSIAILASASLAISLGPIRGGIYAYFGITVDYTSSNNGSSQLTIGLLLLFRGEVTLLGFLSVGLCLALQAQYTSGGGLVGRGHVSYSIKICWCVTINVSASITYTFGSSGNSARIARNASMRALGEAAEALAPPTYKEAATEYVKMFFEVA